jgi:hypothetical protein
VEEKQMKAIVLSDDELKLLEKRFGPEVRLMGSWNSDGTFGHSSVPVVVVEKAAEALEDRDLTMALSRLMQAPEPTKPFIELLETFGPALIERTVAAYRERSLEMTNGTRLAPKPPSRETRSVSVLTATG